MVVTDPTRQLEKALTLISETRGLLELTGPDTTRHLAMIQPVPRTTLGDSFRLSFPFLFPHPAVHHH